MTNKRSGNMWSHGFRLHIQIDEAVLASYGWHDLNLDHGFYAIPNLPGNDCERFTISERVRNEILHRLSELNRQRYQEEVTAGFHDKSATKSKPVRKTKGKASTSQHSMQTSLFDPPDQPTGSSNSSARSKTGNTWGSNATDQILAWLEAHKGWFTKSAILNGCGADPDGWTVAIDELLNEDYIESHGDTSHTTYRAKP